MKPNARLEPLAIVIGEWTTVSTHPMLPGRTFHGRTTYEWHGGGAFLLARMRFDEPEIPDGVAIYGTDDHASDGGMLYFDERGVSREYRWTFEGRTWAWSRNAPDLSQRMRLAIAADGKTIEARGEMSRDGGAWEPDLRLTYTRARG